MNTKGIIFYLIVFCLVFGILTIEQCPYIVLAGMIGWIFCRKMYTNMPDTEISDVLGFTWLHKKFSNSDYIRIMTNIN